MVVRRIAYHEALLDDPPIEEEFRGRDEREKEGGVGRRMGGGTRGGQARVRGRRGDRSEGECKRRAQEEAEMGKVGGRGRKKEEEGRREEEGRKGEMVCSFIILI